MPYFRLGECIEVHVSSSAMGPVRIPFVIDPHSLILHEEHVDTQNARGMSERASPIPMELHK